MGRYLNSSTPYALYQGETNQPYFVDKSLLLAELFPVLDAGNQHICITRPRRFGKTIMANMIAAFLSKKVDSDSIFSRLNTFYIQSHNQQLKGKDFGYRFLWRLVLLAGFATLNAAFFPAGDVLLLFVVVGIILFIVRKWSDKAILITAILFSLQPIEWFHYIMSLFNPAYTLPDLNVGAMYSEVADYTKNGTFWEFLIGNVTLGQKASLFWAIGAGRFLQTAGLFLFGLYIGRKELFVTSESHLKFWTKALIIAAISFAPLYSLKEQIMQSDSSLIQQTVGTAFDMWQKFAFTIVLIASFILLYQKAKFQKTVSNLRFYGKMSLTNYITQSIMGAIIYFPFGFYLAPYCGYTLSLIIGIILFLLQVQFCKWWLSKHKQGPLETIWHRWTWIKIKKG